MLRLIIMYVLSDLLLGFSVIVPVLFNSWGLLDHLGYQIIILVICSMAALGGISALILTLHAHFTRKRKPLAE